MWARFFPTVAVIIRTARLWNRKSVNELSIEEQSDKPSRAQGSHEEATFALMSDHT